MAGCRWEVIERLLLRLMVVVNRAAESRVKSRELRGFGRSQGRSRNVSGVGVGSQSQISLGLESGVRVGVGIA